MEGRRVLITGGSGFLGTGLIGEFLKENATIFAVSRSPQTSTDPRLSWIRAEMRTAEDARSLVDSTRPDVVYHLAGLANGSPDIKLVEETFQSQLASSVYMLAAVAALKQSRLVLIGSLEEPQDKPGLEVPRSPYGAAKGAVRSYARMFHQQYQTDVVTATVMMAYGPGQEERKIVPYAILSRLRGTRLELKSPDRGLDWVYIDDVSQALVTIGTRPGLGGEEMDLGSGVLTSVREVVNQVTRLMGGSDLLDPAPPGAPPPAPSRPGNAQYAFEKIGWRATTSLTRGLELTIEKYRQTKQPS